MINHLKLTGGLKATHSKHTFNGDKGWYEEQAQKAGFLTGHSVILDKEIHDVYKHNNCEGLWDGIPFEIAGAETATPSNIRNALKHCAKKTESKIAVIFFPNENFDAEVFNHGYSMFDGLKGTPQHKKFDLIYCIQGYKDKKSAPKIIQIKKPG